MTHLLGQPIVHLLRVWAQGSASASTVVVAGLVAALVGTAWLVHAGVEKPARRRLQSPRREQPMEPPPGRVEQLVGARP
jgi:peptidoglycan/LPS O-acetylase OafA/YrhL